MLKKRDMAEKGKGRHKGAIGQPIHKPVAQVGVEGGDGGHWAQAKAVEVVQRRHWGGGGRRARVSGP